MAKTFEFRRHSIKDGPTAASIGPKGYALAREVGRQQLRGKAFTHYFISTFWRTQQTIAAFAEGAGDFAIKIGPVMPPIYVEDEEAWEVWGVCGRAEKRGEDMNVYAYSYDDALYRRLSQKFVTLFHAWAAGFPDGSHALVLGHSPHLEMLAYGLNGGQLTSGLKECQGIRVTVDGDACAVDCAAPDLDPSGIRAALFPAQ
jgi:phosphohistidine phosphatase SixA